MSPRLDEIYHSLLTVATASYSASYSASTARELVPEQPIILDGHLRLIAEVCTG